MIEKWFGSWKAAGPQPNVVLPPVPAKRSFGRQCSGSE